MPSVPTTTSQPRNELPPLDEWLLQSPFLSYTYSYPHKTAYRALDPVVPLIELWATESTEKLFLYLHLPFCEYRCGFCNLFTQANPAPQQASRYLRQLRTEATTVQAALTAAHQGQSPTFTQLAIGGGTPTWLSLEELRQLFAIVTDVMGCDPHGTGGSCEASPATITEPKLSFLKESGITRLSMGIQSFDETALSGMGRPQKSDEVQHALDLLTAAEFPIVNLDLIYGADGQTESSWLNSIERVLDFGPEEIFLYPLYVRPLTGLGRRSAGTGLAGESRTSAQTSAQTSADEHRLRLYRSGRDALLSSGYEQLSLRMFRRLDSVQESAGTSDSRNEYQCQTDGMVGLGCGARSYTDRLHYSTEFAVGRHGVQAILEDYLTRSARDFSSARHGFRLNTDEQRRRHLILSLFQTQGFDRHEYQQRFGADVLTHFPDLVKLERAGLARVSAEQITLTESGLERSDQLGPWLYSKHVRQQSGTWDAI